MKMGNSTFIRYNQFRVMKIQDTEYVKQLAQKWQGKEGNLIMILHEVQNHYGYIPRGTSMQLSEILGLPLARIYEVITFYNYFKAATSRKA